MVPPYSDRVSRVRPYSGSCAAAFVFTYVTLTLFGGPSHTLRLTIAVLKAVRTPKVFLPSVWPLPRSLATTYGISVDVSSSPYLDVSVQAVPFLRLFDSTQDDWILSSRVAPFGNPRINGYLLLPEAYRSLSRPSSAPDAKAFPLRSFQLDLLVAKSAWLRFRFRENFARSPAPRFSPKTGFRRGGTGYEFCSELSENSWFSLRIMQALQRSKLYVTLHPFGCCSTINLLRHAFT